MSCYQLGEENYQRGFYQVAAELFEKAIESDPDFAAAHNALAWTLAYDLDTDYDRALTHALRAVDLDPQSAAKQDTLALVYFKLKMFDKALEHYNKTLSLRPDYTYSLRGRGDVHLALGDKQAALEDYKSYLSLAPDAQDQEEVEELIRSLEAAP